VRTSIGSHSPRSQRSISRSRRIVIRKWACNDECRLFQTSVDYSFELAGEISCASALALLR
jgi:hypothetical protein